MQWRLPLILLFLGLVVGCSGDAAQPSEPLTDICTWKATVFTWRDDDRDGQKQIDEPALKNVQILVEGPAIREGDGVTNEHGQLSLNLHIWPCSTTHFTVRALTPPGYQAIGVTDFPITYELPQGRTLVRSSRIDQQASVDPIPLGIGFKKE